MHIGVTAIATNTVTALLVVTIVTVLSVPLLSQCCQFSPMSHQCAQQRYSVVIVIVVAPLSVYISDTPVLLPSLSQCHLGHCYHSRVYTTLTILSLPSMSHK